MIVGLLSMIVHGATERIDSWTCPPGGGGEILGVHIPNHSAPNVAIAQFGVAHVDGSEEWLVCGTESKYEWATPAGTCKMSGCLGTMPSSTIAAPVGGSILDRSRCPVCGLRDQTSWRDCVDGLSFVALASALPIELEIDEGDKLVVTVTNMTGHNQLFQMGVRLGERGVSRVPFWWANVETGRLERALTFPERRLPKGTKIGGLVVVDPATYDGFDEMKAQSCS